MLICSTYLVWASRILPYINMGVSIQNLPDAQKTEGPKVQPYRPLTIQNSKSRITSTERAALEISPDLLYDVARLPRRSSCELLLNEKSAKM